MKILAIIGSPHNKGNTYRIVQKIEERMKQHGDVEFDYLYLKDAGLQQCKGCTLCLVKGEDRCPLKDGRADIERRMQAADGVILASPTYVLNVTALMKNFMDRFAYASHRPRFFKPALAVATTGAAGAELTSLLLGLTAGTWGFDVIGKVSAITPDAGEDYLHKDMKKYNRKLEKSLDKVSGKFHRALRQGHRQPGAFSMGQFLLRKGSFLKEPAENVDRQYFEKNGWLREDSRYYFETKAGLVRRSLASTVAAALRRFA